LVSSRRFTLSRHEANRADGPVRDRRRGAIRDTRYVSRRLIHSTRWSFIGFVR
jgi:hypothetical protein